MNSKQFRENGFEMIEYIANYKETIASRDCLPSVEPGYLCKIVPANAPEQPEKWKDILKDLEPVVMDGMSHWSHPHFHAYFPTGSSWPSILGCLFSSGTGVIASSWEGCPAATELEIIVTDWVAKFLGLPDFFYSNFSNPKSKGGGVIQASASECIFLAMVAARELGVTKLRKLFPSKPRAVLLSMLVGYTNDQSHSSVEKGGMMANVKLRFISPGHQGGMSAIYLKDAIKEDKAKGLYPFFVSAILGSTGLCVFDDLIEIGPICMDHDMWLHVDGAYAGSAFACPEMRYLMKGMEYAWSFNTNANKWMLTNFDISLHWFKYKYLIAGPMSGNDQTIQNNRIVDFRHWGIPMSRRFRAMKLWMVIRNYGVEGLRKYVRNHIHLAKLFEKYANKDPRFEVPIASVVGLTSFRLIGPDESTTSLLETINISKKLHMVPSIYKGKWVIRFALCTEEATEEHIEYAWDMISKCATYMIHQYMEDTKDSVTYAELIKAQDVFEKSFERKEEHEWDKELSNWTIKSFTTRDSLKETRKGSYLIRSTSFVVDEAFDGDHRSLGRNSQDSSSSSDPTVAKNSPVKSMCIIS